MSELYGSSRIPQVSSTIGNIIFQGSTGATGATGPDGGYVTGNSGPMGRFVIFADGISSDTMRMILVNDTSGGSPPIVLNISGVQGISGNETIGLFTVGYTGVTESSVYPVQGPIGLTLFFKSIELQGKITGSYVNNNLFINQSETPFQGDLIPNRLLYLGYTLTNEYYIAIPAGNSNYEERSYSGKTFSTLETLFYGFKESGNSFNFNYSLNSSRNDSNNIIDINSSFYGTTFIDFNLNFSNSTPYLRYGVNYEKANTNSSFNTGFVKFNKREIFNKIIGEETFIPLNEKIGSCCYCDENGKRYCKDYVFKNYCNNAFYGSWNSIPCYLRTNTDDCYPGGACCVNGKCLLSSEEKCIKMGGLFLVGQNCSSITCPTDCPISGCCCVRGAGYTLTEELCAEIPNSRYFDEGCTAVNCCQVGNLGACCIKKVCYDYFSAYECALTGGIFQGVGSACMSQFLNCCTDPSDATFFTPDSGSPNGNNGQFPNDILCVKDFQAAENVIYFLTNDNELYAYTFNGTVGQPPDNLGKVGAFGSAGYIQGTCAWTLPTVGSPKGIMRCWASNSDSDLLASNSTIFNSPVKKILVIYRNNSQPFNPASDTSYGAALMENKNVQFFPSTHIPANSSSWTNIQKIAKFTIDIVSGNTVLYTNNITVGLKQTGELISDYIVGPGSIDLIQHHADVSLFENSNIVNIWDNRVKYANGGMFDLRFRNVISPGYDPKTQYTNVTTGIDYQEKFALFPDGEITCIPSGPLDTTCNNIPNNSPYRKMSVRLSPSPIIVFQRDNDGVFDIVPTINLDPIIEELKCENQD